MRLASQLIALACLLFALLVISEELPKTEGQRHGDIVYLVARETAPETPTVTKSDATEAATTANGATASATNHTTGAANSTSTTDASTRTSTTVPTLNASVPAQNGTNSTEAGALPLQPVVTPALGIGGFILLATGAVLALIGIRNLWVQVFLSTAFLTSIGVTVLIVYVMNPPVRVAVQGAYLVAVFFTGITFGALSIVFKELTEGLGCLLGGFCLSMWLLCLKPGGLLGDESSKSGFIGAISVGIYALSFSHYTRPYALIGSTAAAGGTAVALGIDCFSRAGLKEFWLYIWALNDDIFPLNTNTYPVTRNIRVELAATVIVAILGVISQLRLWNVIRERRRKEEKLRAEDEKRKEEAEAEVGRRLEEHNLKDRLAWEARYNSSGPDIPELGTNSRTCLADEKEELRKAKEIDSLTGSSAQSSASEESYRCSDCRERGANGESAYAPSTARRSVGGSDVGQEEGGGDTVDGESHMSADKANHPPLRVFDGAAAARMQDDNKSEVTAIIGSETGTIRSKRFSARSMLDRMSVMSNTRQMSESQEALVSCPDGASSAVVDMDDDDVECRSVEADADEKARSVNSGTEETSKPVEKRESSDTKITTKAAEEQSVYSRGVEETKDVRQRDSITQEAHEERPLSREETTLEQRDVSGDDPKESQKVEAEVNPTEIEDEKRKSGHTTDTGGNDLTSPAAEGSARSQSQAGRTKRSSSGKESTQDKRKSGSKSVAKGKLKKEEPARLDANTVKQLPQRDSIVVQSYRTNEWAKHLADAEILEPEPIEPIEEEVSAAAVDKKETAAPVKVEELLQTPLNAQPPPAVERHASIGRTSSSTNEHHRRSGESQSRRDSQSTKRGSRSKRLSGLSSISTPDGSQQLAADVQPHPVQARMSGAYPAPTPLPPIADAVEHPREEAEPPKPQWIGPPPLLAVREGLVQNKLTSFSLGPDPWASRMSPGLPSMTRSSPMLPTNPVSEDEDNMPLSRRRTMLHQQTQWSSPAKVAPPVAARWSQGNAPIAGPPPAVLGRRTSARESAYNNQRSLSRTNSGSKIGIDPYSGGPQQRSSSSINIDQAIVQGMQRGDMSSLHRDAMRRMQAKANRNSHFPPNLASADHHIRPKSSSRSLPRPRNSWIPPAILRPPAVRLANPVNYVPRITPVAVPHPLQFSDETPGLDAHREAYPLLSLPERRRSRANPSPNSLVVERSQGESESGRSSIALPRGQRRSGGALREDWPLQEMSEPRTANGRDQEPVSTLRAPEQAHLGLEANSSDARGPLDDRPRHVRSHTSLRSQSQIASIPSHTGQPGPEPDGQEELAWGPAHPCYPHINPHVPLGSQEYLSTRIIRIRRDWMVKGDLAPTFSNLYPEILDPLLPEQEFRKVISSINDELVKAFDPFSLRNWIDGALGLLTGWLWEDAGAPGIKSHLKRVEDWLERWNREVGEKDGVHIWSLRRTAYMSLDIQIPDPKVGIIPSEGGPSLPGTRPSSAVGRDV
ncbi:hypothetical protein BDV59DRAFT_204527 [Aspergillus ambiguus]|uniref:uncharacterized protein n=1 Tax=Aspergillus ambiguus TaxID=176160 RepID=UPI003CCD5B78